MSGIVGMLNLDHRPVDDKLLHEMTRFMKFRGPDAQHIRVEGHVGFGHAMLRTTFVYDNERQPCSLDGQVWITADARIDARQDLVAELNDTDTVSKNNHTDAELILAAYRKWGANCVKHLRGDFAFAIWDGHRKRLFCARDHFGIKPFYYSQVGNCFIFGNTISCLRVHPHISATLDEQAVADFLLYGFCVHPGISIFRDIQKLPPGYTMSISIGESPLQEQYWKLPVEKIKRYQRPEDCISQFKELIRAAISDRIQTDRVGILMSGGLDSTTIAAAAEEYRSNRRDPFDLRAFTFVYDQLISDEEKHYSYRAADSIGIPVHHLVMDRFGPGEESQVAPLLQSLLAKVSSATPNNHTAMPKDSHCRVGLCGHGGDELFHPAFTDFSSWLKNLDLPAFVLNVLKYWVSHRRPPAIGLRTYIRRRLGRNKRTRQPIYPPWLNNKFESRLGLREQWQGYQCKPKTVNTVRSAAYHALNHPLWQNLFESYDPGMTRIPVELRYPYLDLRLVSFCMGLPPVPWCVNKELLRLANSDRLPEAVIRRPKTPLFGFPDYEHLVSRKGTELANADILDELDEFIDIERYQKIARHPEKLRPGEHTLITRPISFASLLQQFDINISKQCSGRLS